MKGLLIAMTEPPPRMEEEFNAWYDTAHLPERLAIPGFSSVPWNALLETPWAKRIDALTQDCEWILTTYIAYETLPAGGKGLASA